MHYLVVIYTPVKDGSEFHVGCKLFKTRDKADQYARCFTKSIVDIIEKQLV